MYLIDLFPSFYIPSDYHQGFIREHTYITEKQTKKKVVERHLLINAREKEGVLRC